MRTLFVILFSLVSLTLNAQLYPPHTVRGSDGTLMVSPIRTDMTGRPHYTPMTITSGGHDYINLKSVGGVYTGPADGNYGNQPKPNVMPVYPKPLPMWKPIVLTDEQKTERQQRIVKYRMEQATNDMPSFQYELGVMYMKGDSVEKSPELSKYWLNRALTNGYSDTQISNIISNTSQLTLNK